MDTRIIEALKNVLHRDNILAKTFRMASHTFKECDYHNAILKLTNNCGADGKRHGMPSATEVAALIVNGTLEKIDGNAIVKYKHIIEAQIITGSHVEEKVYIPKIIMSPAEWLWFSF